MWQCRFLFVASNDFWHLYDFSLLCSFPGFLFALILFIGVCFHYKFSEELWCPFDTDDAEPTEIQNPFFGKWSRTVWTLWTSTSDLTFCMLPFSNPYMSSGVKLLLKHEVNSSCVIVSLILMVTFFYEALILVWEIWCGSRFKGLKAWKWNLSNAWLTLLSSGNDNAGFTVKGALGLLVLFLP